MTWKFLNTGFHSGSFNMEFDETLTIQLKNGTGSCVFRVYGWKPYTISLGCNQKIEDFDLNKLYKAGIDIIRRPTGGRAILHAHELTYSVVMNLEDRGPREIYRFINEGLLCGLKYLGIEAQLSSNNPDFKSHYQNQNSIPCFSSSAKYEIQYEGRKLIGSAQRRYGTVILQHGSLLLDQQHRKIVDFLAEHVRDSKEIIEADLNSRTIDAETILGRHVEFEEAASAVKRGFEDVWNIVFENCSILESAT